MMQGKVLSVETRNLAEPAVADAAIGATTLFVADAATFDEFGGNVSIGGAIVDYTAIDVDENTLTLGSPLAVAVADQDIVEVFPPTPIKTALVDLGVDGGDIVPATVPHTLLDKFPDGTRDENSAESVILEQRSTFELVVSDAIAEPLTQQSLDYVEGEEGYGLSTSVVQMKDAQVTGQIGAAVVSAGQLTLAGEDLGETLADSPRGTQLLTSKGGPSEIHAGTTSGTTALRLFRLAYGAVEVGRLYRITLTGLLQGSVSGDVFDLRIYYTLDGSDPTSSSTSMFGSAKRLSVPGTNPSVTFDKTIYWPCTSAGELKMALYINRVAGTGTAFFWLTQEQHGFQWVVEDTGLSTTATDPAALSQTAKTDGSGSDNVPLTTKTLSWASTHHEDFYGVSFISGGSTFADQGYGEIGWEPGAFGSPQSGDRPAYTLLHFNYTDIVAKLANATSIESVQLKFRVRTRKISAGLDMNVFAHKYTSFPWNMALDMSGEIAAGRMVLNQGSRNDCAPGVDYTITLNTAVGTNLKSGVYKGVGITTPVFTDAGLGSVYAYPSSARPVLIIKFKAP